MIKKEDTLFGTIENGVVYTDRNGYPTEKRKNGYVAFDENKACFSLNPAKAVSMFNS